MSVESLEAVRKAIVVSAPPEQAWKVFTEDMAAWWPLASHSLGGEDTEAAVIDEQRIYERLKDGTEHTWGRILTWEPPHRVVFTWEIDPQRCGNEIEVRFAAEGEGTRVELEHRGWPAEAGDKRTDYAEGWEFILGRYRATAGGG